MPRPSLHAAELDDRGSCAGREVALLVEDAVVRQAALAVVGNLPARRRAAPPSCRCGVGELRVADQRGHLPGGSGQAGQSLRHLPAQARVKQQVFRRIPAQGELGEHARGRLTGRAATSPSSSAIRAVFPATSPTRKFCWASAMRRVSVSAAAPASRCRARPGERTVRTPAALERGELGGRRALATGDDGAGMAHALARRRGDAGDVGHDGLGDVLLDVAGRGLFVRAADLAHHDDAVGGGIGLEQLEAVDEVHAAHGIAADADAGGLAKAVARGLVDRLVGRACPSGRRCPRGPAGG